MRDEQGFAAFEKPQRFRRLVWQAVGEELISPVRGAALLDESRMWSSGRLAVRLTTGDPILVTDAESNWRVLWAF